MSAYFSCCPNMQKEHLKQTSLKGYFTIHTFSTYSSYRYYFHYIYIRSCDKLIILNGDKTNEAFHVAFNLQTTNEDDI